MEYIYITMELWKEDNQFVSMCPELGTASCGDNEQEALDNLSDAVALYLNGLESAGQRERVFEECGVKLFHGPDDALQPTPLSPAPRQNTLVPVPA